MAKDSAKSNNGKIKAKSEEDIEKLISEEIKAAVAYDKSANESDRIRAFDYYMGDVKDLPQAPNRSGVVSKDVSDTIGWMLPAIIRIFTASGQMAEFEPQNENDEEGAKQASETLQFLFMNKNNGYQLIYDATHDSLLHRNGTVKTYWDDSEDIDVSDHSNLTQMQLASLLDGDDVEALAHTERQEVETIQDPETGQEIEQPVTLHDVKLKRIKSRGRLAFDVIEPENFFINESAKSISDARFCAHRREMMRSELVELGYDKDKIKELAGNVDSNWSDADRTKSPEKSMLDESGDPSTDLIEVFECYILTDIDGDGIAETVKATYAGNYGAGELLDHEIWEDDNPFSDIPCQPMPHRREAISVADDTTDMQKTKTSLFRQMMDNVYAHNNPQPEIDEGSVLNPMSIKSPKFGQAILKKKGTANIRWNVTPFIADKSLTAISFCDEVVEKRTGVSRSTQALDPEALQAQTATAVQASKDSAYSKIELIARNQAEGWRDVFRKALKILVRKQDKALTMRLRDEWVEMDPSGWNSDMDLTVNVGLGTGSRDRDMAMLNNVLQTQMGLAERLVANGMQEEALELLPKMVNTMIKIGESAGIKNADDYYLDLGTEKLEEIKQRLAKQAQAPNPEIEFEKQKLALEYQFKEKEALMKIEANKQTETLKAQVQRDKEKAQMEADLAVEKAKLESEVIRERDANAFKASEAEKDRVLKMAEIEAKNVLEIAKLDRMHNEG